MPFFSLKAKAQIWVGSFREKSRSFEKRSKNCTFDFTDGHNFLREKKLSVTTNTEHSPQPVRSIETKISDFGA